jgi:hypothetical protein
MSQWISAFAGMSGKRGWERLSLEKLRSPRFRTVEVIGSIPA